MYFDFEDRHFDTPTVESAISWRERMLLSVFAHLILGVLIVVVPELPFVKDAAARRAQRLVELAEQQRLAALDRARENRMFVFVEPLVDLEATRPPRADAPFSDMDRNAQAPRRAEDPENRLPPAEGNSAERVEAPPAEPRPAERPAAPAGAEAETADNRRRSEENARGRAERAEEARAEAVLPGDAFAAGKAKTGLDARSLSGTGGLLGQALEDLNRYIQDESFGNLRGDTGQFGPWIQFDTKGVEFGPWIRRFVAQIRRNWDIPYAAMSMKGHVVITFFVHKDGRLTDVTVVEPSSVQGFTNAAFNALIASNPTQPLPPEYPDEHAHFTVTFYYNETPPVL